MQKPPIAKKTNFTYKMHGETIKDPYQWFEDTKNSDVKKWAKLQNKYTENIFVDEKYNKIRKSLLNKFNEDLHSAPLFINGYWCFGIQKPKQDQMVWFRAKNLKSKKETLINPNTLKPKASHMNSSISPNWKYFAYELNSGGNEETKIYIKDLKSKKIITKEIIEGCRYGNPTWLSDESGFYYKKPDPTKRTEKEPFYNEHIYFHKMGQNPKDDVCIFGEGFDKEYSFNCRISLDDKYLLIYAWKGWKSNKIFLFDTATKNNYELMSKYVGKKDALFLKDKVIIKTQENAKNGKIMVCAISEIVKNKEKWEVLINEDKNYVLENFVINSENIICEYLHNVSSSARVFDYRGKYLRNLNVPPNSALDTIASNRRESVYTYTYSNFLRTASIIKVDAKTQKEDVIKKPRRSLSKKEYVAEQLWFRSKDKTKVPMFVVHKKGIMLNSNNPTLLYSYGGYGSLELPFYPLFFEDFIKEGGIYVVANIRGGGEFGEEWHKAGSGKNKTKSFEDITSAAEYLYKTGYTKTSKLAILGGSNGGMSVLACLALNPSKFGAVVAKVPLSDMYRFPDFLIASRWVEEKGDPKIKADFERLKKWSPYHNLKKSVNYPPVLITTGYNDSRVHPMHAFKMTARMQEFGNVCYLNTDFKGGHGTGSVRSQRIADQSMVLRFLRETIG